MVSYKDRAKKLVEQAEELLSNTDQTKAEARKLRGYVESLQKGIQGTAKDIDFLVENIEQAESVYSALVRQIPEISLVDATRDPGSYLAHPQNTSDSYKLRETSQSARALLKDIDADRQTGLGAASLTSKYDAMTAEAIRLGKVGQLREKILKEVRPLYSSLETAIARVDGYISRVREGGESR